MTETTNGKLKNIISFLSILILVAAFSMLAPIGYFAYSINSAYTNMQNLQIEKAATHMKKAVFVARYCPQPDEKITFSLNILSTILLAQGNLKEAELVIDQSLNQTRKIYRSEVSLIPAYLAKADLYRRQGNYARAVKSYKNILVTLSQAGKKNELFAKVQRNLSILEFTQEDYTSAEKELHSIDTLYQELSLNTVNNVIDLNLQLGEIAEARGFYKSALTYYNQAQKLYSAHPTEEKSVEALINNLKAELYLHNGDIDRSEQLITKAFSLNQDMTTMEKLQASNLKSLLNLTNLYLKENKFARAKRINQQALLIAETRLGNSHPAFAQALCHKGVILFYEGDMEKSFVTLEKARSLVSNKRIATRINRNIANLLLQAGQLDEAKALFDEVLTSYEQCLKKKHPEYAQTLIEYGQLLKVTGKSKQAEAYRIEADKISQQAFSL